MKKYTKITNEFTELVRDSKHAVIEEGIGFAFNKEQVKEIRKYLNKYFAKNTIIIYTYNDYICPRGFRDK